MTRDEVAKKVEDIIVDKLNVDASEVKDEANFTLDLGADSLDTVELIMEFEKEFDIKMRFGLGHVRKHTPFALTLSSLHLGYSAKSLPKKRRFFGERPFCKGL